MKILLKNEKQPTQVHWKCTMGAQINNQDYNDQVKQEGKNKKNDKKPHSNQGECVGKKKKKNLISNIKCSHPSKFLTFLSRQIHHNKQ